MDIKELTIQDAHLLETVEDDLFDDSIVPQRVREFLSDDRHHLVVALSGDCIVGFASAIHYVHPDKVSNEFWVNELGVLPKFRRQGAATLIINKLLDIAQRLRCSDMWVLTERTNQAAMKLYDSIPNSKLEDVVMFTFPLSDD